MPVIKTYFGFYLGVGGGGSITQPSSSGILRACVLVASKLTLVKRILCLEKYKAA